MPMPTVRLVAMTWIYKRQTEALVVFASAAFAMCLGALIHTAAWGFPVPKAAYLACTIIYVIVAPIYLFFWYHSRLHAQSAEQSNYLQRKRPRTTLPAENPRPLRSLVMGSRPMADTPASSAAARPQEQERGRSAGAPAFSGYPYMPRPAEHVAAHPPAARFSPAAPPASRVPPPRTPPASIPRKPVGSTGAWTSAAPANPTRFSWTKGHAVPPAAEPPLAGPAEPTMSVPGRAGDGTPVQVSARGGTPVERHGARPLYGPRQL